MTTPVSRIRNNELLTQIFGDWPSFHDAEVLQVSLDRAGISPPELEAHIHVFGMTGEVTPGGFYKLVNHTRVGLLFGGVDELHLDDFNHQNVLLCLTINDISSRQLELLKFEVRFDSSFGVTAAFLCETVSVLSADPFTPVPSTASAGGAQSPPRLTPGARRNE